MQIATFGPSTGWAGRTITFYDGRFTLEGHGLVDAAAVLEYDRRGYLVWAYDGLREWVQSLAPVAVVVAPVAAGAVAAGPVASPPPAAAGPLVISTPPPARAAEAPVAEQAAAAEPAPDVQQPAEDLWRAQCLDFDARVLAIAAASGDALDAAVLARVARCVSWDFDAAALPDGRTRAASLYDRAGAELGTLWLDPAALPAAGEELAAAPAPAGWLLFDAPWAAIAAPPGWMGGAPEAAGTAAAAAMQGRGPDWAAWAGEWFTPMTTMYQTSGGQLAALLFAVDAGAATLDEAAYCILLRQELDAQHQGMTLGWRTDDLARRMGDHGAVVESVVYGSLAGRPVARIVAESPAGISNGPRRIHVVQHVFMAPPGTYSLNFTLPSASPQRLGEADRMAATFRFKG